VSAVAAQRWIAPPPAIPFDELAVDPTRFTEVLFKHLTAYGQKCFWADLRRAQDDPAALTKVLSGYYWTMVVRQDPDYFEDMAHLGHLSKEPQSQEDLRQELGL
jgi:hypothetical protein